MMKFIHPSSVIYKEKVKFGLNPIVNEFVCIGSRPMATMRGSIFKNQSLVIPDYGIIIGDYFFINTHSTIVLGVERDTLIGNRVKIGQHVTVGHDCIVEDNVIMANHITLNGFVQVGKGTVIGSGVRIRNRVKIGKRCYIGMGALVIEDIPDNTLFYSKPEKVSRKNRNLIKDVFRRFFQ
jgi:acyl-[acyl carrier protein]--UDP-N-acetylglucosamine O-acyltransferase